MKLALRRALLVLIVAILPTSGCAARLLIQGRDDLRASRQIEGEDIRAAVLHAKKAASSYLPFAPHVDEAYRELQRFAKAAERQGDRQTALLAYRSIRSASLSTRWLIEPHRQDRLDADAAIARLSVEGAPSPSTLADRGPPPRHLESLHRSRLSESDSPRIAWVVVLSIGLSLWTAGSYRLIRSGMGPDGKLLPQIAKRAGGMMLFGAIAFVVGVIGA